MNALFHPCSPKLKFKNLCSCRFYFSSQPVAKPPPTSSKNGEIQGERERDSIAKAWIRAFLKNGSMKELRG